MALVARGVWQVQIELGASAWKKLIGWLQLLAMTQCFDNQLVGALLTQSVHVAHC